MKRTVSLLPLFACGTLSALLASPMAVAQEAPAKAEQSEKAQQRQDLPAAKDVIANYIEAIGGERAIRKHKSMTLDARLEVPSAGINGDLKLMAAEPNQMLVITTIPNMGEMKQGFSQGVGWMINPMMGAMLLEGEMLQQAKLESDFYSDLNYEKTYKTMEVLERAEFNGRPAYKVRLVSEAGLEFIEYFDAESHLKLGQVTTTESPMGKIETKTMLNEYKPFDGVKLPTKVTVSQQGMDQMMTVTSVAWDNVEPSSFELPEQIKTLMDDDAEPGA